MIPFAQHFCMHYCFLKHFGPSPVLISFHGNQHFSLTGGTSAALRFSIQRSVQRSVHLSSCSQMASSTLVKGEARTQWMHCREKGPFPLLVLMWKAAFRKVALSCICIAKEMVQIMLNKIGLRPNDMTWSNPCCTALGPEFLLDHVVLPVEA